MDINIKCSDIEELLHSFKLMEEVIRQQQIQIDAMTEKMHTLTNQFSGKLSATEAEIIAKQVAKETVQAEMNK